MRRVLGSAALAAVLGVAAAGALFAAPDPPHDGPNLPEVCLNCHMTHSSPGLGLTTEAGNANLCLSCHQSKGVRGIATPWVDENQAVPGVRGSSHAWDALAENPAFGATAPTVTALSQRLSAGRIMCSTCHDQHKTTQAGGSQHVSLVREVAGGLTGDVTVDPPAAGATAKGYLISIEPTATSFRISNDNGTSWFGWSGGAWTPGAPGGKPIGAGVTLNDGANVAVSFSGTFVVGDRFFFSISHRFLRVSNVDGALCEQCHTGRVQSAAHVKSDGDGVKVFSHPIGEPLAGTILDANGAAQGSIDKDANPTNDLVLDSSSRVRCTTCHYPHGADSNSLTEDGR